MGWNDKDGKLWTPRSVQDTVALYQDWATSYEKDVKEAGYATPGRIALALSQHADLTKPVLDFGCGTGLSGLALLAAGFVRVDGTDITPEMLERARAKNLYRKLWQGSPDERPQIFPGDYAAITATGVISLGAAPPETLDILLECLDAGGLLAFSYNDATLQDQSYTDKLTSVLASQTAHLLYENYGPHLPKKDMNSSVYVLEKA